MMICRNVLAAALSATLIACGGGGEDSDGPIDGQPTNPGQPLNAIQFKIKGAKSLVALETTAAYSELNGLPTLASKDEVAGNADDLEDSNFFSIGDDGEFSPGIISDYNVKISYSVLSADGEYLYVVVDAEEYWESDQLLAHTNCGIFKVSTSTDVATCLVSGYLADEPSSYYTQVNDGRFKPLQIDQEGNVYFIARKFKVIEDNYGSKWIEVDWESSVLSQLDITTESMRSLGSDADYVQSFIVTPDNSLVYQAEKLRMIPDLSAEKLSTIYLETTPWSTSWYTIDSHDTVIYYSSNGQDQITFAQPSERYQAGVDKAFLPVSLNSGQHYGYLSSVIAADDGYMYGVFNTDGQFQSLQRILPYSEDEITHFQVPDEQQYGQGTSVQISNGYAYYVEEQNHPAYGERDVIRATRIVGGETLTMIDGDGSYDEQFHTMRVKVDTWKLVDDVIYFTGFEQVKSAMVSGEIDTLKLKQGLPEDDYLTYREIASVVDEATNIRDMVVLGSQKPENSGGNPMVTRFVSSEEDRYSTTVELNKWMNMESLKAEISLMDEKSGLSKDNMLMSLGRIVHVLHDTDAQEAYNQPLEFEGHYTLYVSDNAKDVDGKEIFDSEQPESERTLEIKVRPEAGLVLGENTSEHSLMEGKHLRSYGKNIEIHALCITSYDYNCGELSPERVNTTELDHTLSFDISLGQSLDVSLYRSNFSVGNEYSEYDTGSISINYYHGSSSIWVYLDDIEHMTHYEIKVEPLPEQVSLKVHAIEQNGNTKFHLLISDDSQVLVEESFAILEGRGAYSFRATLGAGDTTMGDEQLDLDNVVLSSFQNSETVKLVDETFENLSDSNFISELERIGIRAQEQP